MNTNITFAKRAHDEDWQLLLEIAIQEVFEIMLGCKVQASVQSEHRPRGGFTAVVGLAGALCGVVTVCCSPETAGHLAKGMLGDAASSANEVVDALGEITNMIAGNFGSGIAQMKSTSQGTFDRIAEMLHKGDYCLRIEGHTDNTPIHNAQFPSNWELSASRATEIVRLLIVRDGFTPDRLSAAGYAEYHPVASNRTVEGRGMNRRVDIVILGHALPEPGLTQGGTQTPAVGQSPIQTPTQAAPPPAVTTPTAVHLVDGRLQK